MRGAVRARGYGENKGRHAHDDDGYGTQIDGECEPPSPSNAPKQEGDGTQLLVPARPPLIVSRRTVPWMALTVESARCGEKRDGASRDFGQNPCPCGPQRAVAPRHRPLDCRLGNRII